MLDKKVAQAMRMVREPDRRGRNARRLDMEAGCNVVALWARFELLGDPARRDARPGHALAQRFCVSRASTEMLVAAGQGTDPAASLIRESHTAISAIAEKAMGRAMAGAPAQAVQLLLDEASARAMPS
jgi:hypothetical protein